MSKVKGVIAAGNAHTAEAGAEVLKAGGNAFDAAVAAAWMTFVAEPTMTSAGGGGFLTGFTSNGQRLAIDFFTQTPKIKKPEHELNFYPVEIDYGFCGGSRLCGWLISYPSEVWAYALS